MKAVLMSIRHQHILDMHSGEKTSELRTAPPKIPTPFKVYNYDTESSGGCGKVVSEWICKDVVEWLMYMGIPAHLIKVACVSEDHIRRYCDFGRKNISEMKISNLVIYDEPKPLSEFTKPYGTILKAFDSPYIQRPPQSWCYVEER